VRARAGLVIGLLAGGSVELASILARTERKAEAFVRDW